MNNHLRRDQSNMFKNANIHRHQKHHVIVRSTSNDKKPAFQLHHRGSVPSFRDLEEAHDVCMYVPSENKEDCYAIFNVDGNAMSKFYKYAVRFENMYKQACEKEHKETSIHVKLGSFHIYIAKD